MDRVFYPDKAQYRRPYKDEMEFMHEVTRGLRTLDSPNTTDIEDFYLTWCGLRGDDAARRMQIIGAGEFWWRFGVALREAQGWISSIVERYLPELQTQIDPIDEPASGGGLDLVRFVQERSALPDLTSRPPVKELYAYADSWADDDDLLPIEALRKLTIASKIVALEAIDPGHDLNRDMTVLNELCNERLWEQGKLMLTVHYAIYRDPKKFGRLHPDVPITFSEKPSSVPLDAIACSLEPKCRIARDGDRIYLVMTTVRPKELLPTIIKEEELDEPTEENPNPGCRPALDRRGLMHVIVAVIENGVWRAGTQGDAQSFADFTRHRLWRSPILEEPDRLRRNLDTSTAYRNVKIMGRLHRSSYRGASLMVAPSIEHQIVPIGMNLAAKHATDGLNHSRYREGRIRRIIIPQWFGPHLVHPLANGNSRH